jgi:hypothetical protein
MLMRVDLRGRAGVVPILVLVLLASFALPQTIAGFASAIGIDFYHFWGVPVAMRLTGHTLGGPYRQGERYESVLRGYASTVAEPRLRSVQRFWAAPDFTATPLLYQAFGVVSDDYSFSLAVFRGLQVVSFLAACLLLGYLDRFDAFLLLCLALISLVLYQPLLSDLRVANLGCLQLAALAGAAALASAVARARSASWHGGLAALLFVVLAALTLCKPNVLLVSVLLAVHVAVRHGSRVFVQSALAGAVATALLLVLPCLYFGSWTVWQEWLGFVYGSNSAMLVRPIATGNYATPLFVSTWTGASVSVIAAVLFALLVASLMLIRRPESHARTGRAAPETIGAAFKRLFHDPLAPVALGILLTMATSPLFWLHYYVLLMIPGLWLLNAPGTSRTVPLLAAISVAMSAGLAGMGLWALGWPNAMPATIALSWVPSWAALLTKLRSPEPDVGTERPRRPRK